VAVRKRKLAKQWTSDLKGMSVYGLGTLESWPWEQVCWVMGGHFDGKGLCGGFKPKGQATMTLHGAERPEEEKSSEGVKWLFQYLEQHGGGERETGRTNKTRRHEAMFQMLES